MRKNISTEKKQIIPVSTVIIAVFLVLALLSANLIFARFTLRKQLNKTLDTQMGTALHHMTSNLDRLEKKAKVLNETVSNTEDVSELMEQLEIARSTSALYRCGYLSADGTLYRDDGGIVPDDPQFAFLFNLNNNKFEDNYYCTCMPLQRGDAKAAVIGVTKDVDANGNLKGFFLTATDIVGFFGRENFPELEENGNSCLCDETGKIIEASKGFSERFGLGDNAFELLTDATDKTTSQKNKILQLKRRLSALRSMETSVRAESGKRILIKTEAVEGTDNLYLLVAYREGLVDEETLPALLSAFISTIAIITVLFFIIMLQMMVNYRNNAKMEELAYRDEVTGGWNLNYFKLKSQELIFEHPERSYAIIRFDIANFRYINEAYGHVSADAILKSIATRFDEVSNNSELCARINSDQFLVLMLNNTEFEERIAKFEKLVGDDARDIGVKYPVRFKKGIYMIRREDINLDIMIDHANAARKALKGDEKILESRYSESIINEMKKNDEIVSSMQNALSRGEFKPYLQPKFDIFKNEIVGAEILVRWEKSDGTKVYPSDFIPIFEQNGFIEKLDFYMLECLCERIRKYKDTGKYNIVPVSINQSRILLNNPEYLVNVERIMKRYDTSIDDIQIEITESVFFNDREKMISVIDQLKEMGLILCMDDFGSGYSSLNLLKDVPFDILKIDKDFFSEVDTSKDTMVIMKSIVEMARELGIKVVCEGVETQGQIDMLKSIGCRMVQGYYYSKPIPMAEFMDKYLLKDRNDTAKEDKKEPETDKKDGSKEESVDSDGGNDSKEGDKGKDTPSA